MHTASHISNAARVAIVAEQVTKQFVRRGCPDDPDDMYQDSVVASLVAIRSGRLDESQNPMAYMRRAATREVGLESTRRLAPVSISEYAVAFDNKRVRRLRARLPPRSSSGEEVSEETRMELALSNIRPTQNPEEFLIQREERAAAHAIRVLRRRSAERYLQRLTSAQREALELLLGWDGRACHSVPEAARMAGTTSQHVNAGVKRFKRMAWDDIDLRRLQRRTEALEE